MNTLHKRLVLVLLLVQWAVAYGEEPVSVNIFAGLADAIAATDDDAQNKRCIAADATKGFGTAFDARTPVLEPGPYEAQLRIKLPKINHINTARLHWQLEVDGAGAGSLAFDMLLIERAGVYQTIRCPFVVAEGGRAQIALSWKRVALTDKPNDAAVRLAEDDAHAAAGTTLIGEDEEETELDLAVELEDEPPVAGLKYLYFAVDAVTVTRLGDVDVSVLEVDKIRYDPGDKPQVTTAIHNHGGRARSVKVEWALLQDMSNILPVATEALTLPAGAAKTLSHTGPSLTKKWGYAIRCRVFEGSQLLTEKSEYFTVHDNMWAVSITGKLPTQFTKHVTPENARATALANKRRYRNCTESGFWAPDEFGDFTPEDDRWFGGQGCYPGSVTGTQLALAEGHKVGMSYAVYALIYGGDGPPGFEMVRRHPEWAYASTFNVEWFDKWDHNLIGTAGHQGMHVWPYTMVKHTNDEPIEHHARELVAAHKMFGWDAVRYDNHGISDHKAKLVGKTKAIVHAEVPGFQFGYNSSTPQRKPGLTKAFKAHCAGGGMIFDELIRQYGGGGMSFKGAATVEQYAHRILDLKEEARQYGGHFMAQQLDDGYPNDRLYQNIFWLAGNTHPYHDFKDLCVANYMQFATRFAGQLWDLNVKTIDQPEKWLDVGNAKDFLFLWKEYVHERDLGDGRRQFIFHLINTPAQKRLYTHDDVALPSPQENIDLALKLPGAAKVQAVWFLTPEPKLTQLELPHKVAENRVTFTVPGLRFWSTVVVELDGAETFGVRDYGDAP